jgi:hypothetical protein
MRTSERTSKGVRILPIKEESPDKQVDDAAPETLTKLRELFVSLRP